MMVRVHFGTNSFWHEFIIYKAELDPQHGCGIAVKWKAAISEARYSLFGTFTGKCTK
jgi:hypothetical protein